MRRTGTDDPALALSCCVASILELENRQLEGGGDRLAAALAERGFYMVTVPLVQSPFDEKYAPHYAWWGFWILRNEQTAVVMNGAAVACVPWQPVDPAAGKMHASFLVPYNPIFMRPHRKP